MAFQPIVDLQERRIDAYEALVRSPTGGGAAEVLAKVDAENLYRFDQACRVRAIELAASLGIDRRLSINFLPNAVYEPRACIRATLDAADRSGFPRDQLTFEIVETETIADTEHLLNITREYRRQPDAVLLDINLRDTDGPAFVSLLVKAGDCGVIIVSSLVDETDRIVGLELGADDYICKPPVVRELIARVRAVHRRASLRSYATPASMGQMIIRLGGLTLDLNGRTLSAPGGQNVKLTAAEFTALETLVAADGAPVSRDCICQAALHRPWRAEDRSVDQLIFGLRQKLSDCGLKHLISSIRGAGYRLNAVDHSATVPLTCAA